MAKNAAWILMGIDNAGVAVTNVYGVDANGAGINHSLAYSTEELSC